MLYFFVYSEIYDKTSVYSKVEISSFIVDKKWRDFFQSFYQMYLFNYVDPIKNVYPHTLPKPGKWAVVYLWDMYVDLASFYNFDIWFWSCSDRVVFFSLYSYLDLTKEQHINAWIVLFFCQEKTCLYFKVDVPTLLLVQSRHHYRLVKK